jgi:hypothetical protein
VAESAVVGDGGYVTAEGQHGCEVVELSLQVVCLSRGPEAEKASTRHGHGGCSFDNKVIPNLG